MISNKLILIYGKKEAFYLFTIFISIVVKKISLLRMNMNSYQKVTTPIMLVFSNQQFNLIYLYNLGNLNNKNANRITQNKIKKFKPVIIIYFHNTWYKISLGILNSSKQPQKNNLLIKLHNMRYFCTRSLFFKAFKR